MTMTAVAKHLRVLPRRACGAAQAGPRSPCTLAAGPLRDAHAWLGDYGRFWEGQLDSLAAHVGGPARD